MVGQAKVNGRWYEVFAFPKQYIIIHSSGDVVMTDYFDAENNYVPGSRIIDVDSLKYSNDGKNWFEIEDDHL